MRPIYVLAVVLALAIGCTHPIPSEAPTIRGAITGSTNYGLMVIAPGGEAACDHTQRSQVAVGEASIRRRSGGSASISDLVVGTTVSVWITGVILESCPPIVTAEFVVIEDSNT
jgi:hypothetical protein